MPSLVRFSDEVWEAILQRIEDGYSLRTICRDEGMPSTAGVYTWLSRWNEELSSDDVETAERARVHLDQYARARAVQADRLAEECLEIADDASQDYITIMRGDKEVRVLDTEHVQRSRLRIDTRKWYASKLAPKVYGADPSKVNLAVHQDNRTQIMASREATMEAAARLVDPTKRAAALENLRILYGDDGQGDVTPDTGHGANGSLDPDA